MKTALAVLTCPRQGTGSGQDQYLPNTLQALQRQGAEVNPGQLDYAFVYCDGPVDVKVPDRWFVITNPEGPSGIIPAVFDLWRHALALDVDRLLMFEDDIVPCRNAVQRMLAVDVPPEVSFVSYLDMRAYQPGTTEGLYRTRASAAGIHELWGHQAVVFPRRTLEELCAVPRWRHPELRAQWGGASDNMLGDFMDRGVLSKPYYACHLPCLVEHVGHVSRNKPGVEHHFKGATNFPGEDFDAMTLPPFALHAGSPL